MMKIQFKMLLNFFATTIWTFHLDENMWLVKKRYEHKIHNAIYLEISRIHFQVISVKKHLSNHSPSWRAYVKIAKHLEYTYDDTSKIISLQSKLYT